MMNMTSEMVQCRSCDVKVVKVVNGICVLCHADSIAHGGVYETVADVVDALEQTYGTEHIKQFENEIGEVIAAYY